MVVSGICPLGTHANKGAIVWGIVATVHHVGQDGAFQEIQEIKLPVFVHDLFIIQVTFIIFRATCSTIGSFLQKGKWRKFFQNFTIFFCYKS